MMLVGIPNVGKSALANSLHQIGRISAAGTSLKLQEFEFSGAVDHGIIWVNDACYLSNNKELLLVTF